MRWVLILGVAAAALLYFSGSSDDPPDSGPTAASAREGEPVLLQGRTTPGCALHAAHALRDALDR